MSAMEKLLKDILTQIQKDATNFNKRSEKDRSKNYVTARMSILESNFKSSSDYNKEAVSSKEVLNREELFSLFEKIKDVYVEYRTALMDCLYKLEASSKAAAAAKEAESARAPRAASDNATGVPVSSVELNMQLGTRELKLPVIKLPTFGGRYEDWRSFHDIFVSLIHNNSSLSEIEKLHFFKSIFFKC